jgi:DtxR family Mn-dependent transcriptional regulator
MNQQAIEEILELIWTLREESVTGLPRILEQSPEKDTEKILNSMKRKEYISVEGKQVTLTQTGERYAEMIVRRHRLAERLFKDVFRIGEESMEKEACTWEHILTEEVTDSVCSFLGHPRVCPHHKPIPRGKCCFTYKHEKSITPLVRPLHAAEIGKKFKIAYILPDLIKRLDRLSAFGIFAGAIITIKQKQPAIVISCQETTIALDKTVGAEIFVIDANQSRDS